MNEDTFWLLTWLIGAAAVVALASGGYIYGYTINRQIAEAIKAGGDPIAVSCALDFSSSREAICAIKAAK